MNSLVQTGTKSLKCSPLKFGKMLLASSRVALSSSNYSWHWKISNSSRNSSMHPMKIAVPNLFDADIHLDYIQVRFAKFTFWNWLQCLSKFHCIDLERRLLLKTVFTKLSHAQTTIAISKHKSCRLCVSPATCRENKSCYYLYKKTITAFKQLCMQHTKAKSSLKTGNCNINQLFCHE